MERNKISYPKFIKETDFDRDRRIVLKMYKVKTLHEVVLIQKHTIFSGLGYDIGVLRI